MLKCVFFVLVFLVLSANAVWGLGMSPPRLDDSFRSGVTKSYEFYVVNRGTEPITAKLSARGDLAQYVSFPIDLVTVSPNSLYKTNFTVNYPVALDKPGKYDTRITVTEVKSQQTAGSFALAEVEMYFLVFVPYPGQYLDYSLTADNVEAGKSANALLTLFNRGSQETTAETTFSILDGNGNSVADLGNGSILVTPSSSSTQTAAWETKDAPPGVYKVKAITAYAGKTDVNTAEFKVGDLRVDVNKVTSVPVEKGTIAKVIVEAESFWSQDINDAYAEVSVSSGGRALSSARSQAKIIPAWKKAFFEVFLETSLLDVGTFDLAVNVKYAGKSTAASGTLTLTKPQGSEKLSAEKLLSANTLLRKEAGDSNTVYYLTYTPPSDFDGELCYDLPIQYDDYLQGKLQIESAPQTVQDKDDNVFACWNVGLKSGNAFTVKLALSYADEVERTFTPPTLKAKAADNTLLFVIGGMLILLLAAAAFMLLRGRKTVVQPPVEQQSAKRRKKK